MNNTEFHENEDLLEQDKDCTRIIDGKVVPFKRTYTYNSCKYPTMITSGACARKVAYSLNTFDNIELISSVDDDPMRKELRSLFENKRHQVVENLKDLLAISQQISAIDRRAKEKFRVWLKKVEIQLIDNVYETHQNPLEVDNNIKDIVLYTPIDDAMENKEREMLTLPVQELALSSSANSVWRQARQLKVKPSTEKMLNEDIIIKIDTSDDCQIDIDNIDIERIIYESDIQDEMADMIANNGVEELPIIHLESEDTNESVSLDELIYNL
jgi:hypothetical protein